MAKINSGSKIYFVFSLQNTIGCNWRCWKQSCPGRVRVSVAPCIKYAERIHLSTSDSHTAIGRPCSTPMRLQKRMQFQVMFPYDETHTDLMPNFVGIYLVNSKSSVVSANCLLFDLNGGRFVANPRMREMSRRSK